MTEFDSPWKELIDQRTRQVLELLFPLVAQETDWSHDADSLDQELHKIHPEGRKGKRLADKLLKVRSKSGDERYLHFEVQGQPETDFERRMFVYQYRGDDRFGLPMEALVILADDDPKWRPTQYVVQLRYTRLVFEFKPVKLLDFAGRVDELLAHANPVGLFLVAHLKSRQTRQDPEERARVKLDLIVNLLERKLEAEEMRQWYRWLDWLLDLPPEHEKRLGQELVRLKKEDVVTFVPYFERVGMEKGQVVGLLMGLETALELKFGAAGLELLPALRQIEEPAQLSNILQALKQAGSLDDVRKLLPTNGHPPA